MADYADVNEIVELEKLFANYPPIEEIVDMCISLGIQRDCERYRYDEHDAWSYYYELKEKLNQQYQKTA